MKNERRTSLFIVSSKDEFPIYAWFYASCDRFWGFVHQGLPTSCWGAGSCPRFFFACLKEILAILSFSGRAWFLTWTQVCSVYLGQKLVLVGSGPSSLLDIIIRIERDAHHLEFLVIKVLISFWKKEDSLFKSNKDVYCWISNNWISIYMNTS